MLEGCSGVVLPSNQLRRRCCSTPPSGLNVLAPIPSPTKQIACDSQPKSADIGMDEHEACASSSATTSYSVVEYVRQGLKAVQGVVYSLGGLQDWLTPTKTVESSPRGGRDGFKGMVSECCRLQEEIRKLRFKNETLEAENGVLRHEFESGTENDGEKLIREQERCQMEALLAEKARLASDNDRLNRELSSIQELLEYTMDNYVSDDDREAGPTRA